jgi:hypothetical protein
MVTALVTTIVIKEFGQDGAENLNLKTPSMELIHKTVDAAQRERVRIGAGTICHRFLGS